MFFSSSIQKLAQKYSKTAAQIFFKFIKSLDIIILTGTTSQDHMLEDLEVLDNNFVLEQSEYDMISQLLL